MIAAIACTRAGIEGSLSISILAWLQKVIESVVIERRVSHPKVSACFDLDVFVRQERKRLGYFPIVLHRLQR